MVVAKNDTAHQELARQFHDREVDKQYIALVWGLVQQRKRIDWPIGRDPVHREKISTRARRARSAVTRVTWARQIPGADAAARGDRDRSHAPDSRPSERDRPSDRRRLALWRRSPARAARSARRAAARAAVPARRAARVSRSRARTSRSIFTAPLPDDLRSVLDGIEPELLDMLDERSTPMTNETTKRRLRSGGSSSKAASFASKSTACGCRRGTSVTMEIVRHPGSVVLLPMPAPDRIILIRQYRYTIDRWIWELPAGSLKPGEDPARGAARECEEEIGLVPRQRSADAIVLSDTGLLRRRDDLLPLHRPATAGRRIRPRRRTRTKISSRARSRSTRPARLVVEGEIVDLKTAVGLTLI